MKNSNLLHSASKKITKIIEFDKMEIDNPVYYHPQKLAYMDRINYIINYIKKIYIPTNTRIAEFGCAQANMSLLLAQEGYETYAIDIEKEFLEYSKLKYEYGKITWILSNVEELSLEKKFDVIILGEVIEHCAYPEEIIKNITDFLKVNGVLIITTPNGSRIRTKLKTFTHFKEPAKRKEFEQFQFGPDGDNHLFLFTLNELSLIIPGNLKLISKGYLGSTILFSYLYKLRNIFPNNLVKYNTLLKIIRGLSHMYIFNKLTFNNIFIILKKINS